MNFVYVKLPMGKKPVWDEWTLHTGLDAALSQHGLGAVVGWGTSLAPPPRHGHPAQPPFHRIDLETTDAAQALPVLQHTLVHLHAPEGTEIHHNTTDGLAQTLVYRASAWHPVPLA